MCDLAESCDGASTACPGDAFAAEGASCSTGELCLHGGACRAGTCEAMAEPRDDCRVGLRPSGADLKLADSSEDRLDQFDWHWDVGEATRGADLGRPDQPGGAAYQLCLYDESGLEPALLMMAEVAPGSGWIARGRTAYKFSDKAGAQGGITQIIAKAGADGRASVKVKGKGQALAMPMLPLGLPMRIQLEVSGGACFESMFSAPGAYRNDASQFRGFGD